MYEFSGFSSKNMKNWVSDHCPIAFEVKERGSVVKHTSRFFSRDHCEDM